MGVGRFACVALPFALTVCSIIGIITVMLAGIANKDLYMFELEARNLSVNTSTILGVDLSSGGKQGLGQVANSLAPNRHNFTGAELGLSDYYQVNLWNYCAINSTEKKCSKAKFNWAATSINTDDMIKTIQTVGGYPNATLPVELRSALKTFKAVHKWTQVVYIIAILSSIFTLFLGIFSIFSQAASCVTYIFSGIATSAIILASSMACAESVVAVSAIRSVKKSYHVNGHINSFWIAATWLAVAFSLGAGLFWLFTVCCCSTGSKSTRRRGGDAEKLIPVGAYQRVDDPGHQYAGAAGVGVPMKPLHRGNGAYEPYSHQAI